MKQKKQKSQPFNEQAATAAYTAVVSLRNLFNMGGAQELAEFGLSRKRIRQLVREI